MLTHYLLLLLLTLGATRVPLTYPLHPSLQRSLKYMEAQFIKFVCEGNDESTGKVGQGLLESGNFEGFEEILNPIEHPNRKLQPVNFLQKKCNI